MNNNHFELAAKRLVLNEIEQELGKEIDRNRVFIVWLAKVLQNNKGIFGSELTNNLYEVTYNGDKNEFYLDVYEKVSNKRYLQENI